MNAVSNRKPTLRDLQKAQTRQRLLEAARHVFYREGYSSATVDQIVAEAGASRPTFYFHFRDKEQVLAELIASYTERAAPTMERIPGPRPTVEELIQWIEEIGGFLEREKALFSLVHEVSAHKQPGAPHYGLQTVDAWIATLSHHAPAFAAAAATGKREDVDARARAEILVIDIVWAGGNVARDKNSPFTRATVGVVAKSLHAFLNDPRFHTDLRLSPVADAEPPARQVKRSGRAAAKNPT